jgi:nucleoside-diphosphate-sugar epimerase
MAERPARVFITGASGFIGRRLAERYRELGSEVRGVDVRADDEHDVVAGDVSEAGAWQDQAEGCDVVIHTAARIGFGGDPAVYWKVNVAGTRHALDAAVRARAGRFVQLSSIVVFGNDYADGADETWPVRPTGSPYTDMKVAAEQVVLAAHAAGEIPCTVVRPGDVYGPGSDPWATRPLEAIRSGAFALPDGGRGILSPVYVDNLVDGIVLAASGPRAAGQVFTLTDGVGMEYRQFFAPYHEWLGKRGPRSLPGGLMTALARPIARVAELRGGESDLNPQTVAYFRRRGTFSIRKARELLGYEPKIGFDEGMRRTREWAEQQGLLS